MIPDGTEIILSAFRDPVAGIIVSVGAGGGLTEVLDDPYVTNRLNPMERRALVEEPEVVAAAQAESLDELRAHLEELAGS